MHHIEGLAQEVANAKQRTVVVTWPEVDDEGNIKERVLKVEPKSC